MISIDDEVKMLDWNTLEDIFSQSIINPVDNYRDIIKSMFLPENLLEPFIIKTINNGNEKVVAENIDAISLNINWQIAKNNSQFKKILLENFDKAIEHTYNIYFDVLKEINEEDQSLLIDNWKTIIKRTDANSTSRIELISILNSTEDGKNIVDSNFYEFFYGNYKYDDFVRELIIGGMVTKDKIAELILYEPTRMLDKNIELNSSRNCNCGFACRDR